MSEYEKGFIDGWNSAITNERVHGAQSPYPNPTPRNINPPPRFNKPKRKQSGKAKLLTTMTAPVWKKYKRGNGKKTYVQIRAQVSRSQAYKKKAKRLS